MRSKTILSILSTLLILGTLFTLLGIKPAMATGTIYIRADGSIDPATAPIQRFKDLYTFTADINASIVVQRNNLTIDGNDHKLLGAGSGYGFDISYRSNVTIQNVNIIGFGTGIYLLSSNGNTITDDTVVNSGSFGIDVNLDSNYNNIVSCNVSDSKSTGINVYNNNGNNIQGNILSNDTWGNYPSTSAIWLQSTIGGSVTGNTIIYSIKGGVFLYSANALKVAGNTMRNNGNGIGANDPTNCAIAGNTIKNNTNAGISFGPDGATGNIVDNNIIQYNNVGISFQPILEDSTNNITRNTIANNNIGLAFNNAAGSIHSNYIYHNNFINNTQQLNIIPILPGTPMQTNYWDNGYPSGGNNWSNYTGVDLYSGPYQNLTGSDGIGDTPIIIDQNNVDHYPLMNPYRNSPYALTITSTIGGTTNPVSGTYLYTQGSSVTIAAIPTATYLFDHWKLDNINGGSSNPITISMDTNHALHAIFTPRPDIAVSTVIAYPLSVHQGQQINVNVSLVNSGLSIATFNVVVYANSTKSTTGGGIIIGTQPVNFLIPGAAKTLIFAWNTSTVPIGSYYVSAKAIVSNDINQANNSLTFQRKVSIKR